MSIWRNGRRSGNRCCLLMLAIMANPMMILTSPTSVLDLSHAPLVERSLLMETIQSELEEANSASGGLTIDVSSSKLGDSGVEEVLQSILRQSSNDVHLVSRMNGITPQGVTALVKTLIGDNMRGEDTSKQVRQQLASLDIGWNNLHARKSKKMLASLRSLVENYKSCPHILHFDRCGLGVAACRAMAEVSDAIAECCARDRPLMLLVSLLCLEGNCQEEPAEQHIRGGFGSVSSFPASLW